MARPFTQKFLVYLHAVFNIKLFLTTIEEKVIATVLVLVSVGKDLKTISQKQEQTIFNRPCVAGLFYKQPRH